MSENGNGNGGQQLFNRTVKAGARTYFVDVKAASNGNKYLIITESKRLEKDKYERARIMIFSDKLGEFMAAVQEASLIAA